MPTVDDLGKKVKAKYPGQYDDLPDADLGAKVKARYPGKYDDFADKKIPLFGLAKQAASHKAGIEVEQHKATMESEIGTAKGKVYGDIGKGVALGAATLATGGLAAGPAMGLMGAAGVGAATLDETLKAHFGSEDVPKTAGQLALRLGLEGTLSAAGEGGARAIGQSLKYISKEAIPGLIMRSAAKAEQGQTKLKLVQQNSLDSLRSFVQGHGNPKVDLGDEFRAFYQTLDRHVTGKSQAFEEAMKPIDAKLGKAGAGVLDKQPLDALLEIKSDLSHVTYNTPGINTDEFKALKALTEGVDAKIGGRLNALGGSAASKVYRNYKSFSEQVKKDSAALSLAESGVKKILGKAVTSVPFVDASVDMFRQKAAPWLLEHLYSNEKTAALVSKAINLQGVGESRAAQAAFDAAVNTSGVGSLVKGWISQPQEAKSENQVVQK